MCVCCSAHTHTHTHISSSVIYCLKGNSLIRGHPACKRIEIAEQKKKKKLLFAKELLSANIDLVVESNALCTSQYLFINVSFRSHLHLLVPFWYTRVFSLFFYSAISIRHTHTHTQNSFIYKLSNCFVNKEMSNQLPDSQEFENQILWLFNVDEIICWSCGRMSEEREREI